MNLDDAAKRVLSLSAPWQVEGASLAELDMWHFQTLDRLQGSKSRL